MQDSEDSEVTLVGIMVTLYYGNHHIIVEESLWTGNTSVEYNGKKMSSKNYIFGRTHKFDVTEDGQYAHYEVSLSFPFISRKVTISRNGITIFSQKKDFVPPSVQPQSTSHHEMVTVREVILVVCKNCAYRNEISSRKCEKCGASI